MSAPTPPYLSPPVDDKTKKLTDPWQRWFNAFYVYVNALPTTSGGGGGGGSGTVTNTLGNLTLGNLVIGNAGADVTVLSKGNTPQVLHGNPFGSPIWGAVALTTDVDGVLPVANGGNGTATPAIVAGQNIVLGGAWPAQTVAVADFDENPNVDWLRAEISLLRGMINDMQQGTIL